MHQSNESGTDTLETTSSGAELDRLDHIAIPVQDLAATVRWYVENFSTQVLYQDKTWALLGFANVRLAFVVADQHPPHLAFEKTDAARYGALRTHRDGTRSTYIQDPSGNCVEIMECSARNK